MAFPEAAGVDRICIRSCFFSMASLVEIAPYVTLHMSCLNQQLTLIVFAGVGTDESPQLSVNTQRCTTVEWTLATFHAC